MLGNVGIEKSLFNTCQKSVQSILPAPKDF